MVGPQECLEIEGLQLAPGAAALRSPPRGADLSRRAAGAAMATAMGMATAAKALAIAAVAAIVASCLAGCVEVRQREVPSGELVCRADAECPSEATICDLAVSYCVQCLPERADACTGTSPICGEDRACHGCKEHADCGSNLCLPDGSCAAEADIAYVEARALGTTCTKSAPCGLVSTAVARNKPYMKVSGAIAETNGVLLGNLPLKIFGATGAALTSRDDYVVRVLGTAAVELHGLKISSGGGNGIDLSGNLAVVGCLIDSNSGLGINAPGGILRVERSTISNNESGGINVSSTAKLTLSRNVIVHNGKPSGRANVIGGVTVTSNAGGRMEWNTIAFNQASGGQFRGGATCSKQTIEAIGNVVFHNSELSNGNLITTLATQATTDGCITSRDKVVATDTGNLGFKSVSTPLDFHLLPGSPLIDAAGGSCDGQDIDGQARPQGGACDYGADEAIPGQPQQ